MLSIEKTVDIDQSRQTVFDYLCHFHRVTEWDTTVLAARKITPGVPSKGSRFALVLRFGGNRIPMTYEIIDLQRAQTLVLRGRGPGFTAIDRIALERLPMGTRLRYSVQLKFENPPSPFTGQLIKFIFGRYARKAIKRLRGVLAGFDPAPRLTIMTRLADQAILPGLAGFTRAGYHFAKRRRPVATGLYAGKTMVITGPTSGIGKAAAQSLARKGAHLVLVGRNAKKLDMLKEELRPLSPAERIDTEMADLALLDDVRRLADRLNGRFGAIDVLINNAGALFNHYGLTDEGLEQTLATDLLSPYLLTELLLPALRAAGSARIINVSSGGMYTQGIDPFALAPDPGDYDGPTAYAQAKRGLVLLARYWSEAYAPLGITAHAMHPGWVDTPGLQHALPAFYNQVASLLRNPAQGADTIVWLAAAPDAAKAPGQFWLDRKIRAIEVFRHTRSSPAHRRELVRALNRICELSHRQSH